MAYTHTVTGRIVSAAGKEFAAGDKVDAAAEFGCYLSDVKAFLKPIDETEAQPVEKKSKA
jgi:hypothetical protein